MFDEASKGEPASRSASEPVTASLRKWKGTVRQIGMKSGIGDEAMGQAIAGLPGVREGSAQGQISQEIGRASCRERV